jgi:hypothetical protein
MTPECVEKYDTASTRKGCKESLGHYTGKRYLLMDRDSKFTEAFRHALKFEGIESVVLPPRSPNLNPHIERFMKSLKTESLDRMIFFGGFFDPTRPKAAFCLPSFERFVTSTSVRTATRLGRPLPGQDFHLLELRTFHGTRGPGQRCRRFTGQTVPHRSRCH